MKVLHVLSSLNVGGAERLGIDLAVEQRESQGFSVNILSMGDADEPLEAEVRAFNLPLINTSNIKKLRTTMKSMDIVHVHSAHCLLRILLASLGLKVRIIFTHHNDQVYKNFKWKLIHLFASFRIHKITFVVKRAEDKFIKTYPIFHNKVATILNGVPIRKTTKKESEIFRLGHVGRFAQLKAQHILIQAISALDRRYQDAISLLFYGTGDLLTYNQELARTLIPNVDVEFHSFITDRDEIYSNIDCLVVTSETEGLSLAILESISSGTPIIASDVGGNSELITNNVNGYLYPFGDIEALAQYIQKLVSDHNNYQYLRNENLKIRGKGYPIAKCAQGYADVYK